MKIKIERFDKFGYVIIYAKYRIYIDNDSRIPHPL